MCFGLFLCAYLQDVFKNAAHLPMIFVKNAALLPIIFFKNAALLNIIFVKNAAGSYLKYLSRFLHY